MKARLITLALALTIGAVGCGFEPLEVCNKRGGEPGCRTIWVPERHEMRR